MPVVLQRMLALALALSMGALSVHAHCASHPDSRSSSRVVVDSARGRVELTVRCQSRSLIEALSLDDNDDGRLDQAEVELGRAALTKYVPAHYQLFAGAVEHIEGAVPLSAALRDVKLIAPEQSALDQQWVELTFDCASGGALDALTVRSFLFRDQNPFHRDEAQLVWDGEAPARRLFSTDSGDLWVFRPASARRGGVLADYTREGILHILTGYDHLAFLCALILAARRLRSVIGVITAFTVAHSITLALASLELVHVPSMLVEMAIALSIAYVAALNLLSKEPSSRWGEAFVFGLVHGLGFAGAIGDALAFEPLKLTALFGFNLGVECGQLSLVLPLSLALAWLPGSRASPKEERAWLAPSWARRGGSTIVCALGLYWFLQRAGAF